MLENHLLACRKNSKKIFTQKRFVFQVTAPEVTPGASTTPEKASEKGPKFKRAETFIRSQGLELDNLDDKLDLAVMVKFLEKSEADSPDLPTFKEIDKEIDGWGQKKLFNESDHKVFMSDLAVVCKDRGIVGGQKDAIETKYGQAHEKYLEHRTYIYRILHERQAMNDLLKKEQGGFGSEFKDDLNDVAKDIKKNYRGMSGGEKALAIGGLLFLTAMFIQSENATVTKIRDTLVDCLKIAGVGLVANTVYKLFTGKTAITAISEEIGDTSGMPEHWQKAYNTDVEGGMIIRDSMMYMGHVNFLVLASKYKYAKTHDQKSIKLDSVSKGEMTPEEIYKACDIFFTKHFPDGVQTDDKDREVTPEQKYSEHPSTTWRDAIAREDVENKTVEMQPGIISRVGAQTGNYVERAANAVQQPEEWRKAYVAATGAIATGYDAGREAVGTIYGGAGILMGDLYRGMKRGVGDIVDAGKTVILDIWSGIKGTQYVGEGWEWAKSVYRDYFGEWGNDATTAEHINEIMEQKVIAPADFPTWVKSKFKDDQTAKGFEDAFLRGTPSTKHKGVTSFRDADAIYVIAQRQNTVKDEGDYWKGMDASIKAGKDFLKDEFKSDKDFQTEPERYAKLKQGVYVLDHATVLIRMALPGTDEFKRRKANTVEKGGPHGIEAELWGPNSKIDYAAWSGEPWKQRQFRLNFMVDHSQITEIDNICNFLTKKYTNSSPPLRLKAGEERPFSAKTNGDYQDAVDTLQYDRQLRTNEGALSSYESDLNDIEEEVAEKAKGAQAEAIILKEIKNTYGLNLRLAILGDTEALNLLKGATFKDGTPVDVKKQAETLEWYEEVLTKKYV